MTVLTFETIISLVKFIAVKDIIAKAKKETLTCLLESMTGMDCHRLRAIL